MHHTRDYEHSWYENLQALSICQHCQWECYPLDETKTIIDRCITKGRMTMLWKRPARTIMISEAKPDVLRIFLGQLDEVLDGRGVGTLKEITKDKKSDLKGPVKIVVTSRNEYRKSFENVPSATLKTLILSGIGLKKVDTRWFSCSLLTSLHLSKNQMNSITDLVKMRLIGRLVNLQVLNMSHNGLMRLPIEMMASFPPSLLHLDLSFNLFRSIPSFSYMPSLTILNMANNRLEILPHDLRNRRSVSFNFDNNQIKFLPCMSSNVRQTFSITGNSLNESVSSVDLSLMKCPSRLQWAMQSIKINRIRVEESIKARFWEEEGIDFCDYCAIPLAADRLFSFVQLKKASYISIQSAYNTHYPTQIIVCLGCYHSRIKATEQIRRAMRRRRN